MWYRYRVQFNDRAPMYVNAQNEKDALSYAQRLSKRGHSAASVPRKAERIGPADFLRKSRR